MYYIVYGMSLLFDCRDEVNSLSSVMGKWFLTEAVIGNGAYDIDCVLIGKYIFIPCFR